MRNVATIFARLGDSMFVFVVRVEGAVKPISRGRVLPFACVRDGTERGGQSAGVKSQI